MIDEKKIAERQVRLNDDFVDEYIPKKGGEV